MAKTALVPEERSKQIRSKEEPSKENKLNPLVAQTATHYQNARGFLEDVRAEMRKVVTPSRKEVQATTTVVLATVFIFAAYFFCTDYVFSHGVAWVMAKLSGQQ